MRTPTRPVCAPYRNCLAMWLEIMRPADLLFLTDQVCASYLINTSRNWRAVTAKSGADQAGL
jgi:hypothetical protein